MCFRIETEVRRDDKGTLAVGYRDIVGRAIAKAERHIGCSDLDDAANRIAEGIECFGLREGEASLKCLTFNFELDVLAIHPELDIAVDVELNLDWVVVVIASDGQRLVDVVTGVVELHTKGADEVDARDLDIDSCGKLAS